MKLHKLCLQITGVLLNPVVLDCYLEFNTRLTRKWSWALKLFYKNSRVITHLLDRKISFYLTGKFNFTASTGTWNGHANWCFQTGVMTFFEINWSWLVILPFLPVVAGGGGGAVISFDSSVFSVDCWSSLWLVWFTLFVVVVVVVVVPACKPFLQWSHWHIVKLHWREGIDNLNNTDFLTWILRWMNWGLRNKFIYWYYKKHRCGVNKVTMSWSD